VRIYISARRAVIESRSFRERWGGGKAVHAVMRSVPFRHLFRVERDLTCLIGRNNLRGVTELRTASSSLARTVGAANVEAALPTSRGPGTGPAAHSSPSPLTWL